jgi:ribonucleoside-diphosphate reductase alpha chain
MPRDSTVDDVEEAYLEGWRLGLKALAIYRDGSKESQPVSTSTEGERDRAAEEGAALKLRRERLPETRQSITHKFSVGGHEGYVTVGLYDDGRPGELFITMAKEGSTIGGLMDVFGTAISMGLQYGVPLDVYVNKFAHSRFEPSGWTRNPDIPMAKSLVDYIFRWLGMQFIPGYREANAPQRDEAGETEKEDGPEVELHGRSVEGAHGQAGGPSGVATPSKGVALNGQGRKLTAHELSFAEQELRAKQRAGALPERVGEQFAHFQTDAPPCDNCGAITVRHGNCYLCHNCGNSMGCS